MSDRFLNPDGYTLKPDISETIKQRKQIYLCLLDSDAPVSFWDGETLTQFNKKFNTDLGSIPILLQWIKGLSKDDWEICYLFHDNCCKTGGLWINGVFTKIPRNKADALLKRMIPVEAKLKKKRILGWFVKYPIYFGVRLGSFFGIGK